MQEHVHFNALKHHLDEIKKFVQAYSGPSESDVSLQQKMNSIGNRTLDLYFGPLAILEIKHEINSILNRKNLLTPHQFLSYLEQINGHYFTLNLTDQSTWVLRKSQMPGSYIHIHPGRYSKHTIRTHGNALKTALFVLCRHPEDVINIEQIPLTKINEWRKELYLSPVRSTESLVKIQRLITLITQE